MEIFLVLNRRVEGSWQSSCCHIRPLSAYNCLFEGTPLIGMALWSKLILGSKIYLYDQCKPRYEAPTLEFGRICFSLTPGPSVNNTLTQTERTTAELIECRTGSSILTGTACNI